MVRKIKIQISNKVFYTFLSVLVVLVLTVGINAYNPSLTGGEPSIFGHSVDEIQGACPSTGTGCTFLSNYYTKAEIDSKCETASPPSSNPSAPTSLFAFTEQLMCPCAIQITWQDNSNNENNFELYRQNVNGGAWNLISSPSANTESYSEVYPSSYGEKPYAYRIRACNSYGCSTYDQTLLAG